MDEPYGRSVRDLLPEKLQQIDEVVKGKLIREPGMDKASIPGFVWHVAGSRVTEAVRSVLDCDAFGLLARAWTKARELHEYTNEAKYPPNVETTAFLGNHTMVTNIHPIVEISVLGFGQSQLRFTLELAAEFRSAELRIVGGCIVAIGAGDCTVSAQLKYNDVKLHDKLNSSALKLSEPMSLIPALRIA